MTTRRVIPREPRQTQAREPRQAQRQQQPRMQPLVPSAPDAERALIGSLLIAGADAALVDECARMIDHTSFLNPAWACAWRSIWRRAGSGEAFDVVLVSEDCERDEEWPQGAAPMSALFHAAEGAETVAYATWYAKEVADRAYQRRVIATAATLAAKAYQHDGSQADLAAAIAKEWEALDVVRAEMETGDLGPVFARLRGQVESGIPTGMNLLDEWSGGAIRKRMWTIVGYSGVGKTWLACSIINGLVDAGAKVGFASLEMSPDDLVIRMLAGRVGPSSAYRFNPRRRSDAPPTWSADELAAIDVAERRLEGGLKIFEEARTLPAIESVARRGGFDVLVVDYGQLVELSSSRDEYQDQTRVAQGLRALAKKANCTVIVLSQISEATARTEGGGPISGKGTGAWRAVSDLLLWIRKDKDSKDRVILSANKNRFGPDEAAGATTMLHMDTVSGVLREMSMPTMPAPTRPYPAGEPVTPWSDRESRDNTGEVW